MTRKTEETIATLVEKPDNEYSRILRGFAWLQHESVGGIVQVQELTDICKHPNRPFYIKRFSFRFTEMCNGSIRIKEPILQVLHDGVSVCTDQIATYEKYKGLLCR
jgi:hypothetical protein